MDKLDIHFCDKLDTGYGAVAPFVRSGVRIYQKFNSGCIGIAKYNQEGNLVSTEFFDLDSKLLVDTPS